MFKLARSKTVRRERERADAETTRADKAESELKIQAIERRVGMMCFDTLALQAKLRGEVSGDIRIHAEIRPDQKVYIVVYSLNDFDEAVVNKIASIVKLEMDTS